MGGRKGIRSPEEDFSFGMKGSLKDVKDIVIKIKQNLISDARGILS